MTTRNLVLIIFLSLFFVWYVSRWAYQTQYLEPRERIGSEIIKLSKEIDYGRNNLTRMTQFWEQNKGFYYRSLPRSEYETQRQQFAWTAQTLYSRWLRELLLTCGLEHNEIKTSLSSQTPFWTDHQFSIQCVGSLSQFADFLIEFYNALFLHQITSMTLTPMDEEAKQVTFSMTVNVLALRYYPYAASEQVPQGNIQRLALPRSDWVSYKTAIADHNFLRATKGGVDRADYTVLTGLPVIDGQTVVWFKVQIDDTDMKATLGDTIQVGSFSGRVVEILDQDIVIDRGGSRWLLEIGEHLKDAFALPPESGNTYR